MSIVAETLELGGAILGGMTAIAAAIRWSVGRLAKSNDRAIAALVENAKSHATLAAKFDNLMGRFEQLARRFDRIVHTIMRDGPVRRTATSGVVVQAADATESQRVRSPVPAGYGRPTSTGSFRLLSGETLRDADGEITGASSDPTAEDRRGSILGPDELGEVRDG